MSSQPGSRVLPAWIALCLALALHVADEAANGFLSVYNPTVMAIRQDVPWFPMPVFEFGPWLAGLVLLIVVLLAVSPLVSRGSRLARGFAYAFAVLMILNGVGHTLGTIFGQTVNSVRFARPMPGFYSSPFMIAAAVFLLIRLRAAKGVPETRPQG